MVLIASGHNIHWDSRVNCAQYMVAKARSLLVAKLHSTTPFICRVLGAFIFRARISCSAQIFWTNAAFLPALSHRKYWHGLPEALFVTRSASNGTCIPLLQGRKAKPCIAILFNLLVDTCNSHIEMVQVIKPQLRVLLCLVHFKVGECLRQVWKVLFSVDSAVLLL